MAISAPSAATAPNNPNGKQKYYAQQIGNEVAAPAVKLAFDLHDRDNVLVAELALDLHGVQRDH